MENNKLTIMNEKFTKEGSKQEVDGLTIMIDGVIKQVFDRIRQEKAYDSYNEVMRDVIFEGINAIVKEIN